MIQTRMAQPDDSEQIVQLVRELAAFEGAPPDAVRLTVQDVREYAFGSRPRFQVLIGEVGGQVQGLLVFYETFSTWTATPSLHVEDFYLRPAARGLGLGRALMERLGRIAGERNCARIGLNVLDWNTAQDFYRRLGFDHKKEWRIFRLDGAGLNRLANGPG